MDFWQRGSSFSGYATFNADRWQEASSPSNSTVTKDTSTPTGFQYSLKSVNTGAGVLVHKIESIYASLLAGKQVTLSFYMKTTSGTPSVSLTVNIPTAKDDFTSYGSGGLSSTQIAASTTSSWTRYTKTFTMPAEASGGVELRISTSEANTSFYTGFQLEVGSSATEFTRFGASIDGEWLACCRYYYRIKPTSYIQLGGGSAGDSATMVRNVSYMLPTPMRSTPTLTAAYTADASELIFANTNTGYSIGTVEMWAYENGVAVMNFTKKAGQASMTNGVYYSVNLAPTGSFSWSAEL